MKSIAEIFDNSKELLDSRAATLIICACNNQILYFVPTLLLTNTHLQLRSDKNFVLLRYLTS